MKELLEKPKSSDLLRAWDKSSHHPRMKLLECIYNRYEPLAPQTMLNEMGANSTLLYIRITTNLRLTYSHGKHLETQIRSLKLFWRLPNLLDEFMEMGGTHVLLDISLGKRKKACTEAYNALVWIAGCGRVYRELICTEGGVQKLEKGIRKWSDQCRGSIVELLKKLLKGNPKYKEEINSLIWRLYGENQSLSKLVSKVALELNEEGILIDGIATKGPLENQLKYLISDNQELQALSVDVLSISTKQGNARLSVIKCICELLKRHPKIDNFTGCCKLLESSMVLNGEVCEHALSMYKEYHLHTYLFHVVTAQQPKEYIIEAIRNILAIVHRLIQDEQLCQELQDDFPEEFTSKIIARSFDTKFILHFQDYLLSCNIDAKKVINPKM